MTTGFDGILTSPPQLGKKNGVLVCVPCFAYDKLGLFSVDIFNAVMFDAFARRAVSGISPWGPGFSDPTDLSPTALLCSAE